MRIRHLKKKLLSWTTCLVILLVLTTNTILTFKAMKVEDKPSTYFGHPTVGNLKSEKIERTQKDNFESNSSQPNISHLEPEVPKNKAKTRVVQYVHFTYGDPMTYKGPIVDGWPPGKNRSLPRYLNIKDKPFLIQPEQERSPSGDILFLVHSGPENFSMRDGVRKTWFFYQNFWKEGMLALFIVGIHPDPDINRKIQDEAKVHGDILQANFDDHYNNLTLKTLFCFKYALERHWAKPPKYLFKVDDDSFVNVDQLQMLLTKLGKNTQKLVMGHLLPYNPLPKLVSPSEEKDNFTKKWVSPSYMFNGSFYPPFVSGSGYFLSMDAVDCIYKEVLKLPFFHLEDVLINGFGAQNCNITLTDSKQFFAGPPLVFDIASDDIMIHYTDSLTKNILLKVALFDKLQAKYNNLIAQLGSKTNEKPWTLPSNHYFKTPKFSEEYVGRIPKSEFKTKNKKP